MRGIYMITISDNSTNQINTALLRLDNNIKETKIELTNKISSDVGRLELKIDEIKAGTMVYTAGPNISISSSGVISVIGLSSVATSGDYNDLLNKPTITSPVQSDWTEADPMSLAYILNKPTIPAAQVQSDWTQVDNTQPDYIKNKPTIPAAQVQSDWTEADPNSKAYIQNKPLLATVATSGSYNDLLNTPTIPAAPVQSDWSEADPTSLAYILNKPTITNPNDGTTTLYQGNATSRHLFGSWSANQSATNNVYIDTGFTYIVDSDDSLKTWQLGTAGYDFTSVLIKRGTWNLNPSNGSIVLDARGTKRVYGEPGSKIQVNYNLANTTNFNIFSNSSQPTNLNISGGNTGIPAMRNKYDMWIENVSIEVNDQLTSNYSGRITGFYYVANLHNCRVYFHRTATGSTGGKAYHYGFYYCYYLNQCQCNTENSRQYGRPFSYCNYLSNCDALSSGYQYAQCYAQCNYLSTCTGTSVNLDTYSGAIRSCAFSSCYYMTACYGYGSYHSGASLHGCGAISCYCLTSCSMYGYAVGFSGCYRMNSCFADSSDSTYPGIYECYQVIGCASRTGFYNSYASHAANATYACADTPNGGFNWVGY